MTSQVEGITYIQSVWSRLISASGPGAPAGEALSTLSSPYRGPSMSLKRIETYLSAIANLLTTMELKISNYLIVIARQYSVP